LTWKRAELKRYQASQFVIIVQIDACRYKVLQVVFGRDGSLYVSFPYFDNDQGIVSIGTLSELSPKTTVKLETTGKVTTNKVKFSHHLSGDVQFSQTGKVKTAMKKKSLPLNEAQGHIFTFHAQGLHHFEADPKNSDMAPSLKRTELSFRFEGVTPSAIKIVGRWYEEKNFMSRSKGSSFGPLVLTQDPEGKRYSMFLIGPPESNPLHDYVLVLTCEETSLMDSEREATMFFIGGFGKSRDESLYQRETFLCASYPIVDYNEIERRIGSIDLAL
jgi:hypothetical protein